MNRNKPEKIIIAIVFASIAVIAVVGIFVFGPSTFRKIQEWQIQKEISKANYCEVVADCRLVATGKCPFDCYVYVNKNEAERIGKLIEGYESRCAYMCVEQKEIVCANNICQQECFGGQCKDQNSWWKRKIKLFTL